MQSFFAEGVNLDRCPGCHGTWLDDGELASLTEGRVGVEPLEGETARRCHPCKRTLETCLSSVGIPVERCPSCQGLFLDAGELEEVNWHEDAETQRKDEKLGKFFFFYCASCGEKQDTRRARETAEGLICASCFKGKFPAASEPGPGANGTAWPKAEGGLRGLLRRLTG